MKRRDFLWHSRITACKEAHNFLADDHCFQAYKEKMTEAWIFGLLSWTSWFLSSKDPYTNMAKDKKKTQEPENFDEEVKFLVSAWLRVGESRRRLMHLVPAPAVRLMKRRVQSRPGLRQENRPSLPQDIPRQEPLWLSFSDWFFVSPTGSWM